MTEDEKELQRDFEFMKNFQHITYEEKISRATVELMNTDPEKIMKWGWEEWDNRLGGIYGGKVYVIGANTGVGKTTFVNQVCNNVSNQGFRVTKYSLEDRIEDIGKEEIFYTVNRILKGEKKDPLDWIPFVNNEYPQEKVAKYIEEAVVKLCEKNNLVELDKKKQVNIDDLCRLMEEEAENGTKLFAIDHLHYFEMDGRERTDLQIQNVMHKINEIARKYNVAILLVAHYRKGSDDEFPSYDEFKDGGAIKQVANVIIQITRNFDKDMNPHNRSRFHITKIRGPIAPFILESSFNLYTFEHGFIKSERQKEFDRVPVSIPARKT